MAHNVIGQFYIIKGDLFLVYIDDIKLLWLDMVIDLVEKQFQTIFSPFNPIDLHRLKMLNRSNNRFTNQAALNFQ